jgi:bifunctional oligoribonuclease and PAP phosphatase NrnA
MPEHQSNLDLAAAADLIRKTAGPVFITTHAKPDGDAFGSVVALASALKKLGQQTFACFAPPVPASLLDLNGNDLTHILDDKLVIPSCSLYVVLDTGAWSQVEPMRAILEPNLNRILIIDHHLSGDIDAGHKYIDADAGACAEIIAELLDLLAKGDTDCTGAGAGGASGGASGDGSGDISGGGAFSWCPTIAQALFVGIGSDTGWFRFSNTRPQTHRLAARLLEMGVDHADLYARLHQTERPAKLALLTRALDSLTLLADGRAAVMCLTARDFAETGALEEESERLIDVPQQVESIQVVALVCESSIDPPDTPTPSETPPGAQGRQPLARISFRSKPGPDAINVADLAAKLGGGGHARAAGAKLQAPIQDALVKVTLAITQAMKG